jgi:hypothetical protein
MHEYDVPKKSAVPNGIGNKATLPPTATNSPPPQVKLVLAVLNLTNRVLLT